MRDAKTILLTSIIVLLVLLYAIQSYEYINLINTYNNVLDELQSLKEENRILRTMVARSIDTGGINNSIEAIGEFVEGNIVAVSIDNENMEGVLIKFKLAVRPGDGNIFISISPHVGVDLQTSLEMAREAAGRYLGINLSSYDIYLVIDAPSEVGLVDGPSAGLMLTLAIVSAFEDLDISNVCVTGAIDPSGNVLPVGGIIEKAVACVNSGMKKFIIPKGQSKVVVYEKVEKTIFPGFTVVVIEPREVDLNEYLRENGYQLEVYEASNLQEAIEIIRGS